MSDNNVHLLVLIHGMWGNPKHLASMHRIMKETRNHEASIDSDGAALHVMLPETNQAESTYDGIDWGGERVADEASISIHPLSPDNISNCSPTDISRNR